MEKFVSLFSEGQKAKFEDEFLYKGLIFKKKAQRIFPIISTKAEK